MSVVADALLKELVESVSEVGETSGARVSWDPSAAAAAPVAYK